MDVTDLMFDLVQGCGGSEGSYLLPMIKALCTAFLLLTSTTPVCAEMDGGTLNLGSRVTGHELETYGDVFAPLWQNERAVLFAQPYSRNSTGTDTEAGLGFGWRQLLTDDWALGLNAFYDHSWLHGGNRFDVNQFGAGLEVIGSRLDFRANYYLPQTNEHVLNSVRVGERAEALGDPYGTGHRIAEDYQISGINLEHVVAAGRGWDAEIGALVPGLDKWVEMRAYVGGYWYANQAGPDLKGLKARAEARLTSWLYADAGWIEDKAVAGGHWFAGFRVSVPLGKVPSAAAASVAARKARDRMMESVERNGRAVVSTHKTRVTEELLTARRSLTLYDDVVFVDNRYGKPGGAGTFEKPVSSIQGGVDLSAGFYGDHGTVFVQGGPLAYGESVAIRHGVQLYGSGRGLPVESPLTGPSVFQGRNSTTPVVTGGFLAHDVAGTVGITGFEFIGSLKSAYVSATGRTATASNIFLENVGQAVVAQNTIHNAVGSTAGVYIEANGAAISTVLIASNLIRDNPGNGIDAFQGIVLVGGNSGRLNAMVAANSVLRNGGDGVVLATLDTSTINASLSGNFIALNATEQIVGLVQGGEMKFFSQGTVSNTVRSISDSGPLYEFFSLTPQGEIFINGALHPADTNLP